MSNRTIYFLTACVLLGISILLVTNFTDVSKIDFRFSSYLSPKEVRGISIFHNRKEYPLNFSQQNALMAFLNASQPDNSVDLAKVDRTLDFEKITIYLFNAPNLEIQPIGYVKGNLLFSNLKWNGNGYLRDTSEGKLKALLSGTFDP